MAVYTPPPNGFRTFVIVWITQSVSVIGSALTLFAMNIWLMQTLYPLPEQKPQLAWAISATNHVPLTLLSTASSGLNSIRGTCL